MTETVNWRDNAGGSLLDPNDPHGNPLPTPLDRRWLWRLARTLNVTAGNQVLKDLTHDLWQYLHETCEHHWLYYAADEDPDGYSAHRQCLWCCTLLLGDDPDSHYVTFYDTAIAVLHPKKHCQPAGQPSTCAYQDAVNRIVGNGAPVAGRWRVAAVDGEGLPDLERADDRPEASAA